MTVLLSKNYSSERNLNVEFVQSVGGRSGERLALSLKLRLGCLEAAVKQHRSWIFDASLAVKFLGEPNIEQLYRFL